MTIIIAIHNENSTFSNHKPLSNYSSQASVPHTAIHECLPRLWPETDAYIPHGKVCLNFRQKLSKRSSPIMSTASVCRKAVCVSTEPIIKFSCIIIYTEKQACFWGMSNDVNWWRHDVGGTHCGRHARCCTVNLLCVYLHKHIEADTKCPTFSRRHVQVHFLEWKCLNSAWNLTEVCS